MLEDVLCGPCGLDLSRPVLAGISGGPDSLCLLEVLRLAGYRVIVAHFDHRLRPGSGQECQQVAEHAAALGLPFVSDVAEVGAWAQEHGFSIEEAARTLRYRFLFAAARRLQAQAVAVGHTADDQVETVLMHFLRGAGLAGLKGMTWRSLLPVFDPHLPLVRPLLGTWRHETEAFCRQNGLTPHDDQSNRDETFFRNRLRHSLIPLLEQYNPRFKEALLRSALGMQGDHALIQDTLNQAWERLVVGQGTGWLAFRLAPLAEASAGLQRGLLRRAVEVLCPEDRDIGFEAVERGRALFVPGAGGQVDLSGGLLLFCEAGRVYLATPQADLPFDLWPQVETEQVLEQGGVMLGNGWQMLVEWLPVEPGAAADPDPWTASLDADRLPGVLSVRGRRPGDLIQPLGMGGQGMKVADLMINAKLPRRARRRWPLVCAGEQVAWVAGLRLSHAFRLTPQTRRMVRLRVVKK